MTTEKKHREIWVPINQDSVDKDKLTHIALFEKPEDDSVKFIESEAYEELKAENDNLKRELADKMNYGCCIVEHGYRMEAEQCLKDVTAQLQNTRLELVAANSNDKHQHKLILEMRNEIEILKSKQSQYESTITETMRVRDLYKTHFDEAVKIADELNNYTIHSRAFDGCINLIKNGCDCGLTKIREDLSKLTTNQLLESTSASSKEQV